MERPASHAARMRFRALRVGASGLPASCTLCSPPASTPCCMLFASCCTLCALRVQVWHRVLRECDRKFCDQVSPFSESIFGFNQFYDSAASELSKWVREYSNVSAASRCLPRVPILRLLVMHR